MGSRFFRVAAGAVALATAAACGGTGGGQAAGQPSELSAQDVKALGGKESATRLQDLYQKALEAGEHEIVIYGITVAAKEPVYKRFSKRFPGITVKPVPAGGADLLARVNNEFASGQHVADFTDTGNTTTVQIYDQGRYVSYRPFTADDIVPYCVGPEDTFFCENLSAFGITYNTDELSPSEAPKSWSDLLDPKWKGKATIWSDPTSAGPSLGLFSAMLHDGRYDEGFLRKLAAQNFTISSEPIVPKVARGQHPLGFPGVNSFFQEAKGKGAPIGFVFPVQGGNLVTPSYLGLLKESPHPNAAKLFMNWVYTPEAVEIYTTTLGYYHPLSDAPPPEGFPPLTEVDQFKNIPFDELLEVNNTTLSTLKDIYG